MLASTALSACTRDGGGSSFLENPGSGGAGRNSSLESLGIKDIKSSSAAVIVNYPENKYLQKITSLTTFDYDNGGESLLLIPVYNKSRIEIKTLVWENNELKDDRTIYSIESTSDGYALHLKAIRPEGMPALKIYVQGGGINGEYILSYNGRDGTPPVELITGKTR
jgi:hypothetical protein